MQIAIKKQSYYCTAKYFTMKKYYSLFFLLGFLQPNIYGQSDSLSNQLSEIIIRENRLEIPFKAQSRSITVLTNERLKFLPVQSVAEALQSIPGLDLRQRAPVGMQADLHIRGGSFDQALVLLNGVRLSDPQTGHHLLNLPVDMQAIRQIEVLKGPGARIFGQNAFAGAVNIITEAPDMRRLTLGMMAGDFGLRQLQVYASLPVGRVRQHCAVTAVASDGFRHNTDFAMANVFYQAQWRMAGGQWDVLLNHNQRAFGANGFYGSLSFTGQYEEIQTNAASIGYRTQAGLWTIKPRLYWRRNQDMYVFLRENPDVFRNFHLSQFYGAEINAARHSPWGHTGAGLSADQTDLYSNRLGQRTRTAVNLFAEHRFSLLQHRLDLTPGISGSLFSDFGAFFFPGLDAGYALPNGWKLFANTGITSRIPTYTDLYYEDAGNKGNPDLKPERAFSNEIGVKWLHNGWNMEAALFSRYSRDGIDWTRNNENEKWTTRNFNRLNMQGADCSVEKTFDHWLRRVQAGYTFIHATVSDEVAFSKYSLNHLRHQLTGQAEHRIGSTLTHSLRARWCDRVTNTSAVRGDYWVADSRLTWSRKRWTAYAEASNLFNTVYGDIRYSDTSILTMPGRWFRMGVQVKLI